MTATLITPPERLAAAFRELSERWRAETLYLSSTTEIATHPAYQRIIGLGPQVIPAHPRRTRGAAGALVLGAGGADGRRPCPGGRTREPPGDGRSLAPLGPGERLGRVRELELAFPGLAVTQYRLTSPADERYNCIAWSVADARAVVARPCRPRSSGQPVFPARRHSRHLLPPTRPSESPRRPRPVASRAWKRSHYMPKEGGRRTRPGNSNLACGRASSALDPTSNTNWRD